jgi:serine/threonine protein phosphatase PrpC
MILESYYKTDPGLKRSKNEDTVLVDNDLRLYIVCDGVGGHSSGAIASEMASSIIHEQLLKVKDLIHAYNYEYGSESNLSSTTSAHDYRTKIAAQFEKAVQLANDKIFSLGEVDLLKRGLCTTTTALLILDTHALIAHVGDSRIYMRRNKKVHLLTKDHKLKEQNVLLKAVGYQARVEVDVLQVEVSKNDEFFVCSDGFYQYLSSKDQLNDLTQSLELSQTPSRLISYANSSGGSDNISLIYVLIKEVNQNQSTASSVFTLSPAEKAELFGKIPFFRFLTYTELQTVLNITTVKEFKSEQVIFNEGSVSDALYLLLDGSAEILKDNVRIAQKIKGETFGEMGIFDQAPRSATVSTRSGCKTLVLYKSPLMELLKKEQRLAVKLLWALVGELNQRLRNANELLVKETTYGNGMKESTGFLPFEKDEG